VSGLNSFNNFFRILPLVAKILHIVWWGYFILSYPVEQYSQ